MIRINWFEGLGNNPAIHIEENLALLPREECEFIYKEGMWYHIQENGLVRYFVHDGKARNNGGFGGATFTILHNGEPKSLIGPWSGRASYLSALLPAEQQVADIILDNGGRNPISIGILASELKKRWDHSKAYLLRVLQEREHGAYTASLAPDCIRKPDGSRFDRGAKYEVLAEPVNVS